MNGGQAASQCRLVSGVLELCGGLDLMLPTG